MAVPSQITGTINNLVGIATGLGAAALVLFIVMAGFQFMTSGGSTQGQQAAKQSLIYAGIGFAIIVLAQALGQMLNTAVVR